MHDLPNENELRDLVQNGIIERYWPLHLQQDIRIENQIKLTVRRLRNCNLLDVDADFNSYGSGFASYVHVFCTKANRGACRRVDGIDYIDGIAVYLGRLVPFAAFGKVQRTKHKTGSSDGFLEARWIETTPDDSWVEELQMILTTIEASGFTVLPKADYNRKLPISLDWETNFDTDTYFDAFFYWYD